MNLLRVNQHISYNHTESMGNAHRPLGHEKNIHLSTHFIPDLQEKEDNRDLDQIAVATTFNINYFKGTVAEFLIQMDRAQKKERSSIFDMKLKLVYN